MTNIERFVIDKVIEMRRLHGFSQSDLADLMSVSSGFIGKVESYNFNSKYNLNHINILSKIFKCSPQDFLPQSPL